MSNTFNDAVYVILINDDNTVTTTQKRRIVQRSKLVDTLWFLVHPDYNGHDMANYTLLLEYLMPVSKRYKTEILSLSADRYNEYLKYQLPVDTNITAEAGDVEFMLTFLTTELDENGKGIQRSRKITGSSIHVTSISAWSDIIPDCALSAIDQRIIKMDAQIKALNETNALINDSKADNITYDINSNELQLLSGERPIGNKVVIMSAADKDGMPAVDIDKATGDDKEDNDSSDVVEF